MDTRNAAAVDQLSAALMDEFFAHLAAYRKREPDADERHVFEGWIIQKIAGIHYILGERPGVREAATDANG